MWKSRRLDPESGNPQPGRASTLILKGGEPLRTTAPAPVGTDLGPLPQIKLADKRWQSRSR
jgi:hypothetical protein